jgi:hypothetical protein
MNSAQLAKRIQRLTLSQAQATAVFFLARTRSIMTLVLWLLQTTIRLKLKIQIRELVLGIEDPILIWI